jgi:plasmid stability protein
LILSSPEKFAISTMASITIRNLDAEIKARLRVQAAHHGRSMEEEARHILRTALASDVQPARNLGASIRRRFASIGGVELDLPPREPMREPPDFGR